MDGLERLSRDIANAGAFGKSPSRAPSSNSSSSSSSSSAAQIDFAEMKTARVRLAHVQRLANAVDTYVPILHKLVELTHVPTPFARSLLCNTNSPAQ